MKKVEASRELLKEYGRENALKYLNSFDSLEEQVNQINVAFEFYRNSPQLKPNNLQPLIEQLKAFHKKSQVEPNAVRLELMAAYQSAKEKEKNELISLLKDLDSKTDSLDSIIGDFSEWQENYAPEDWQERISKLSFLKEAYPLYEQSESIKSRILSEKCLEKIQELSNNHDRWGVNQTFEKAFQYSCCQTEIVDGEKKKIGSWSTLRGRVRDIYPAIYKKTKAK